MVDGPRERRAEVTAPREHRADAHSSGGGGGRLALVAKAVLAIPVLLGGLGIVGFMSVSFLGLIGVLAVQAASILTSGAGLWQNYHFVWLATVSALAIFDQAVRSAPRFDSTPGVVARFTIYTPLALFTGAPLISHTMSSGSLTPATAVVVPVVWCVLAASVVEGAARVVRPSDEQEPPGMDLRFIGPDESQFDGSPSKEQAWDEWFESELDGDRRRWRR